MSADPRFEFEHLRPIYENAAVSLAASGKYRSNRRPDDRLPPHLWEALRVEMQRRWREATGEEHAILKIKDPTP